MAMGTRGCCAGIVLLVLALCLLPAAAWAAETTAGTSAETPRMRRLGAADGMPSRMVLALAQDRQGYIWAATDDGLARVDGVGLRVWRHDPADPGSIPGNEVETLLVDPMDRVWVGVNGVGLSMLAPGRAAFQHFTDLNARCDGQFWSLAYAAKSLWIGTNRHGICRRGEDGSLVQYHADPNDPTSLPDDTIEAEGDIVVPGGREVRAVADIVANSSRRYQRIGHMRTMLSGVTTPLANAGKMVVTV